MEFTDYFRFVLALVFVLSLVGLLAWAIRRMGMIPGTAGFKAGRRLNVIESTMIDTKRKLVLVRRDDVEHLLVLGPESETVVETGIEPPPQGSVIGNTGEAP